MPVLVYSLLWLTKINLNWLENLILKSLSYLYLNVYLSLYQHVHPHHYHYHYLLSALSFIINSRHTGVGFFRNCPCGSTCTEGYLCWEKTLANNIQQPKIEHKYKQKPWQGTSLLSMLYSLHFFIYFFFIFLHFSSFHDTRSGVNTTPSPHASLLLLLLLYYIFSFINIRLMLIIRALFTPGLLLSGYTLKISSPF